MKKEAPHHSRRPSNPLRPPANADFELATSEPPTLPAQDTSAGPATRCTILIADDEPAVRESLKAALECQGYATRCVANGQQAVDLLHAETCDIAILDLTMPIKCGWDAFEEISRSHPLLPVIILTARHQQLIFAHAAGVAALLEKPIEIPELTNVIERLLRRSPTDRLRRLNGLEEPIYLPRHNDLASLTNLAE